MFYKPIEQQESISLNDQYNLPNQYLLSVGSIQKRKNLKLIIESYQYLDPEHKLPLVIIGRGKQYKKEVIDLISLKGLENKVIWITDLKDNRVLSCLLYTSDAADE